jgi:ubiquinol-cytochrome c reductase cytochrome b subunit
LDPLRIMTEEYFGSAEHLNGGDMAAWVVENIGEYETEDLEDLRKVVIALSAEAKLPAQQEADQRDAEAIAEGRELLTDVMGCIDCHKFHDAGDAGIAPDLTGYGSREWLIGMISNPSQERFYGHVDADVQPMPAFATDPDRPLENRLRPHEVGLIADWLRGDWYEPEPATPAGE